MYTSCFKSQSLVIILTNILYGKLNGALEKQLRSLKVSTEHSLETIVLVYTENCKTGKAYM
jgi:hypothetical protein